MKATKRSLPVAEPITPAWWRLFGDPELTSLARQRYVEGVADFLNVLDAERSVLSSERELSNSTTQVSTNLVVLYKALGGEWKPSFPDTCGVLTLQQQRSPYGTVVPPEGR